MIKEVDTIISCEFNLCIYHEDGMCTLRQHSIDALGICGDAIQATIPHDVLVILKKATLESVEGDDA